MTEQTTRKAIEAVWRIESARLLGGLVRIVRDIGLAEDLAQNTREQQLLEARAVACRCGAEDGGGGA